MFLNKVMEVLSKDAQQVHNTTSGGGNLLFFRVLVMQLIYLCVLAPLRETIQSFNSIDQEFLLRAKT